MSLDEVIGELVVLLERHPTMPFAQYMIKLPDRGGMYHLTLTPPGHTSPQETVVALEKEREGLRGQLAALEPLAANVTALEDSFKQQVNVIVENSASLSGVVARQTQIAAQTGLDARALVTEVKVLAGDVAQLPARVDTQLDDTIAELRGLAEEQTSKVTAQVGGAMLDAKESFDEVSMQLLRQMDIVLQRAQDLQSFMGNVAQLLRQVEKTDSGLHTMIESLPANFSAYEEVLHDWAIEARGESQRSYVDLTTVIDSAVADLKEVSRIIEALSDQVADKALSQGRETAAVVAATVTGTIDRVAALQQDIMRHVIGATAASREGTQAVLKHVDDARVDIAQYLTSDLVDAAEAMRGAIQQLPDQGSLVTRIFALESELGMHRVALDAAERLVHSVKDVPADLLSPQLRDLRSALGGENGS